MGNFTVGYAQAKLNLFLHVIGKRKDGYHLLQSVFIKLSLADRIKIYDHETISCNTIGKYQVLGENLVVKVAEELINATGIKKGARIEIEKNIPTSAGLGGGAADAAAVLKMLNKEWGLNLNKEDLCKIGLKIGADVPFCLYENHAFVEGIGELVTPFSLDETLELVLINSGERISAAEIYKNCNFPSFTKKIDAVDSNLLKRSIKEGKNDLEKTVLSLYPNLTLVKNALLIQEGCTAARVSGSGATYFGIFASKDLADKAFRYLSQNNPTWWIRREGSVA